MQYSPISPRPASADAHALSGSALAEFTHTPSLNARHATAPRAGRFWLGLASVGLTAAVLAACATGEKDGADTASDNTARATATTPPANAAGAGNVSPRGESSVKSNVTSDVKPNGNAGSKSGTTSGGPEAAAKPAVAKTGAGLFSDVTQPGKGTPKPRERAATATGDGKIIPGSVNVYTFNPNENFVPVDPSSTSIAQVLADMGPDAIEWYQHVQTLSNPWFEGRVPGSDGIERAAEYCEFWMTKAGLEPAFASGAQANPSDPWRQPFALPGRDRSIKSSSILVGGTQVTGATKAMKNSGGGTAELPVTFVGYGIENGKDGYTNFSPDARFEGRIVLVMRGEPLDAEGKSRWGGDKFTSASSLAAKLDAIRRRGANGIVVIEPPGYAGKKADLTAMSAESLGGMMGVPCFFADGPAAERLRRL